MVATPSAVTPRSRSARPASMASRIVAVCLVALVAAACSSQAHGDRGVGRGTVGTGAVDHSEAGAVQSDNLDAGVNPKTLHRAQNSWPRAHSGGFAVSHPETWQTSRPAAYPGFIFDLLLMSSTPLQDPCRPLRGGGETCRMLPPTDLGRDGVEIRWYSEMGIPTRKSMQHGTSVSIDGQVAVIQDQRVDRQCGSNGGTRQLVATFQDVQHEQYLVMYACLANHSSHLRDQVLASLYSLRTSGGHTPVAAETS